MRAFGPAIRQYAAAIGWAAVGWVIIGWRLGYPSFWDPDEATYAEVSREMLASHSWLVPLYDGQPFFDKPPLFYVFQMAGFSTIGATELAARSVSALSALALIAAVIWFGRNIFSRD